MKKLTKAEMRSTVSLFKKNGARLAPTAAAIGISTRALQTRLTMAATAGLDVPAPVKGNSRALTDETLQETVDALARAGSLRGAARLMGTSAQLVSQRLDVAEKRGITTTIGGYDSEMKPREAALPPAGSVHRFVLTCAQNSTLIHPPVWDALHRVAKEYGAQLIIGTITYAQSLQGSAKRGTNKQAQTSEYDPRIEPYVRDEMIALAPTLIWNGHVNIIPTAVDPLEGLQNYNQRASSIFPHTKCALSSVPSIRSKATKLQYTTGAVTKRNYIQKKSGQKAEFDHVYGGLLVEVESDGSWWARQLNVSDDGRLIDLDTEFLKNDTVKRVRAVGVHFGDIHVAQLEDDMRHATWGPGGMVDTLDPEYQFAHDILDFESAGHHNLKDPFKMFELHARGRDSVSGELDGVLEFLKNDMARPKCKVVIVQSNHDRHFERWLRDTSWKTDPRNALLHSRATTAYLEAINAGEPFNALRWAISVRDQKLADAITWADPDEGFVILKGRGDIQMGLHGDLGPNGSRGTMRNLARLGQRMCIGHSHQCGIFHGVYMAGVKAKLNMSYAMGSPSSWTQSDIVVLANGKRQIVTWWNGRYRAAGKQVDLYNSHAV